MVDICREKKTGMAEECRQSDGKRALRACTECGILLGASGVLSCGVVLDLLHVRDLFIGCSCERNIAVVQT